MRLYGCWISVYESNNADVISSLDVSLTAESECLDTQDKLLMLVVRTLKLMKVVKSRTFDEMPSSRTGSDNMTVEPSLTDDEELQMEVNGRNELVETFENESHHVMSINLERANDLELTTRDSTLR